MSRILPRAALALLAIVAAPACDDEPLGPGVAQSGMQESAEEAEVRGTDEDRRAIRNIVNALDRRWTAGDPVRYAALYARVADFVGPDGTVLNDPAAITELYTALFSFVFPNTTRQSSIRRLTFLTPNQAVLDIDTRVTGFESLPPGVVPWRPGIIRALEKNVLKKQRGKWSIALHQQTLVAPES
jgi:uncharacterized protein (TIGR02246 family)